jgi:hypothetical protein
MAESVNARSFSGSNPIGSMAAEAVSGTGSGNNLATV